MASVIHLDTHVVSWLHEGERGRIPTRTRRRLEREPLSMSPMVELELLLSWTRDPFDRLIVANALADGADLVTADERIRQHTDIAVWG